MSRMRSTGGAVPLDKPLSKSKDKVLTKNFKVPPLKLPPRPETPPSQSQKAYENALVIAERQLEDTVNLKELADSSEISRIIERAKGLVKDPPQYDAAKVELEKIEPIHKAQKEAAELKKKQKEEFAKLLPKAKDAVKTVKKPADTMPLTELILASEGLAERGQYTAAIAKLSTYEKVVKGLSDKAGDETKPEKEKEYRKQLKVAQDAVQQLTTGAMQDLGDPEPLQKLIEAATVQEKAGRFASALEALGDTAKIAKEQLELANSKLADREKYLTRQGRLRELIQEAKGMFPDGAGKNFEINCATDLFVMNVSAGRLAQQKEYGKAAEALADIESVGAKAIKAKEKNAAALKEYAGKLKAAKDYLARLKPPLADVEPLTKMISDAEHLAEKTKYAAAVKLLGKAKTEFDGQQKREKERGPKKEEYDKALVGAEKLLTELAKVPQADTTPLEQLVTLAKSLAAGGNFDLANKTLARAAVISKEETEKAKTQAGSKADFEREFKSAEEAHAELVKKYGDLADAKALQGMIDLGRKLGAGEKYATGLQAIKDWKKEAEARTKEAEERLAAKGIYDGKLKKTREEATKLKVQRYAEMVAKGVTDAEGMALAGKYVEAVAKLDLQLKAVEQFLKTAKENEGLREGYEKDRAAADLLLKKLENLGRDADPDLIQAKAIAERATRAAAEGNYRMAGEYVRGMMNLLDKAETAAQQDEDKADEYRAQLAEAEKELDEITKLGATATPQPLEQMIKLAGEQAKNGMYADALRIIQPHKEKFNELMTLHKAEAGKKGDYEKQLKTVEEKLLKLQQTEYSSDAEVKKLIEEAKNEAKANKFASACALLAEAGLECEQQTTRAQAVAKENKQVASAKPKYEDRRKQVEELLGQLLLCPGTEGVVAEIRQELKEGEDRAKKQDFKFGQKLFKKTITKAKEAKKKSEKALNEVGELDGTLIKDEYGKIKKLSKDDQKKITALGKEYKVARETVVTSLNSIRAVALPAEVEKFDQRIVVANSKVLSAKQETKAEAGIKNMREGIDELNKVAQEIAAALTPATRFKDKCEKLSDELHKELQTLLVTGRSEEVQPLQGRLDKIKTMMSAKDYEAANMKLDALQKDVTALSTTIAKNSADWENAEKEIPGINKDIKTYLQDPILASSAQELMNQIANITRVLVIKEKNYRQAVEEVGNVKNKLTQLKQLQQKVTEFKSERETADKKVKAEDAKIGTSLTKLKEAMKKADPAKKERSPAALETERKKIMDEWAPRAATAPDAATLNAEATLKALAALAEKIEQALKDPGAANKAADNDLAAAGFETARAEADKALEPVRARGGKEAAQLEKEFNDTVKGAPDNYAAATTKMNDLKNRAAGLVSKLDNERLEAVVKARTRAAAATKEIDSLVKSLKQWFPVGGDLSTEFAKFFEEQKKQIAALEGLREGGNFKAIASAEKELDTIMGRARAAAADASNTTKGSSTFKNVLKKRKALEDELQKPALKKCCPDALEKLQKEFKEISEKTQSQEPVDALTALEKFENSLKPALEAAERAQKLRVEIQTKAAEALKALEAIKGAAPEYYKKLLEQVKKAKEDGKKEKGEQSALTLLGTLKATIDKAATMAKDKPSDLASKEKGAREEKAALENARRTWESSLDVFEKTALPAAVKAVANHPEGDSSQIEDLKKLQEKAEKAAKAGDYLDATKQIEAATKVAERVKEAPQGVKATSRDNMPAVEQHWQKAVQAFSESIKKVDKELVDLAKTEEIKELLTIRKVLDHLALHAFDPNAFGEVTKVLSTKGNKPAERRAARELALRFVREYRSTLKDPVLVVLFKGNPFAKVPLNQINAALDDLDLNIQRCV